MFDRAFDKIIHIGQWMGRDIRRVHVFCAIVDLLVISVYWIILSELYVASTATGITPELFNFPRSGVGLAVMGLFLIHYAVTPWGQCWVKAKASSFVVVFLTVTIGCGVLGFVLHDYARQQALAAGYLSCDLTFVDKLHRKQETFVAPGVLCPPVSHAGKPYPPPGRGFD